MFPTVSHRLYLIVDRLDVVVDDLYFAFDNQHILVDSRHALVDPHHVVIDVVGDLQKLRTRHRNLLIGKFIKLLDAIFQIRPPDHPPEEFLWKPYQHGET